MESLCFSSEVSIPPGTPDTTPLLLQTVSANTSLRNSENPATPSSDLSLEKQVLKPRKLRLTLKQGCGMEAEAASFSPPGSGLELQEVNPALGPL